MSFLWNWWSNLLDFFGLSQKSARVLFLGLEHAGKTTLLCKLKDGTIRQHQPTMYATCEELKLGNNRFTAYDLGGHDQARAIWERFMVNIDGIVFMLDAANPEWFSKANRELQKLLSNPMIEHCPIVILANKIDKPEARYNEEQLKHTFSLHSRTTGKENIPRQKLTSRPLEIFMCSIRNNQGYPTAIRWLAQYL